MNRFSAASLGQGKELGEKSMSSVSQISSGLHQLGLVNDEGMKYLQMATAGMQILVGSIGIATAAKMMIEAKNSRTEAESAVKTAAMTIAGPWGWKNIAIAAGVSVLAGATIYACIKEIRLGDFDLSTAEGRNGAIDAVQGAI